MMNHLLYYHTSRADGKYPDIILILRSLKPAIRAADTAVTSLKDQKKMQTRPINLPYIPETLFFSFYTGFEIR